MEEFALTPNGQYNVCRALYRAMPRRYKKNHKFNHMLKKINKLFSRNGVIIRRNKFFNADSFVFVFTLRARKWLKKYKFKSPYFYITNPYNNVIKG
jgi:uncharacterized protein YkuJ